MGHLFGTWQGLAQGLRGHLNSATAAMGKGWAYKTQNPADHQGLTALAVYLRNALDAYAPQAPFGPHVGGAFAPGFPLAADCGAMILALQQDENDPAGNHVPGPSWLYSGPVTCHHAIYEASALLAAARNALDRM